MAEIVELEFDGGTMQVELKDSESSTRGFGDEALKVAMSVDQALEGLRAVGNSLHNTISGMVSPPDNVSVTLGLNISGSGKFIIAQANVSANLQVTMEWTGRRS